MCFNLVDFYCSINCVYKLVVGVEVYSFSEYKEGIGDDEYVVEV